MGKWATYRKRGTVKTSPPPGPPPKPFLYWEDVYLIQDNNGAVNPGGRIWLEQSPDGVGDWEQLGDNPYQDTFDWASVGADPQLYNRVRTEGNGTDYAGFSEWSDIAPPRT